MFVSFLMPHVDRGAGPLFHLIMLLQMSRFAPDEICFMGDEAYFDEAHVPFGEELALGAIRFNCVSQERFRAYRKATLPFAAVASLYERERSHLDAFQSLLTADHPPLGAAIGAALDEMAVDKGGIEAFLTWSNCPSLSALAAKLGKPVVHNELGPLRAPAYQDTVYFDFQGVNGNTTPATKWTDRAAVAAQLEGAACLGNEQLRKLLYCGGPAVADEAAPSAPAYRLGVALQVEDDSNTLAYGRGYDAIRLLYQAQRNLAPEQVLVRSHPGARMAYRGGLGDTDTSPSSLVFLQRIAHLMTINSSVAAEAALWGVPYTVLGDTPFAVCSTPLAVLQGARPDAKTAPAVQAATQEAAAAAPAPASAAPSPEAAPKAQSESAPDALLNALMLGYLVPASLLFDPDYYRWRLAGASLRDCHARHLEVFRRNAIHADAQALPRMPAPGTQAEAASSAAPVPHRNAALWSATRSLSRGAEALQKEIDKLQQRIGELETELATAIAERDKNWEERCWFQTDVERAEQEILSVKSERDTLRLAVARVGALDEIAAEAKALRSLHGDMENSLAGMNRRFDEFTQEMAQARSERESAAAEAKKLRSLHDAMALALSTLQRRFDAFGGELARERGERETAQAQSLALLDELHRTQRERIDALATGATLPTP